MNGRPKVSVGIPVRNGEAYIEECLDSVLAQTFPDFEVVVSDNASTDGTPAILRACADRDARIRLLGSERNRGAAANFNAVLAASEGEYFKWMAADDVIGRTYLETLVPVLDARPEVVLAYPKSTLIDARSDVIGPWDDNLFLDEDSAGERFRRALRGTGRCHPVFGLVRRAALARTGRIGSFRGADVVLLAELALYGRFHEAPERLHFRRMHDRMSSHDNSIPAQQEFYAPRTRGRLFVETWTHHLKYLTAIGRSPLPRAEKAGLALHVLRRLVTLRRDLWRDLRLAGRRLLPPRCGTAG